MNRKSPQNARNDGRITRDNYARKTAALYDGIAEWYVRSFWNDETDSDWIHLCLSALKDRQTVADVGSGPGNYARFFREAGHEVTCIDISAEMIHAATSRLPGVTGVVSDMRHMPFEDNRFDCVFCAYSVNHVVREDFRGTLEEFERILRPGGIFCLMLKTGSVMYEFSNAGNPESRGVMCLFSSDEVTRTVQAIGVSIVVVRHKDEASEREFQHEKMLLIGNKPSLKSSRLDQSKSPDFGRDTEVRKRNGPQSKLKAVKS